MPLDVALRPSREGDTLVCDARWIDTLVARLRHVLPTLIVREATEGWEPPWSLPVIVANPRHVRDCANATGQWAKADQPDAWVLARLTEAVRPTRRRHPDAVTDA